MTPTSSLCLTPYRIKATVLACALVAMAGLSACGKKDDGQTVGQKIDSAVISTEQAAAEAEAKAKAEASMAKAGETHKRLKHQAAKRQSLWP